MKKLKYSKKEFNNSVEEKPIKNPFSKKNIVLVLIGIGIISIMVGSALNLWQGNTSEEQKYKDYKFVRSENFEGGWNLYYNGNSYQFDFLPQEIENLTDLNIKFSSNNLYILFNPGDSDALAYVFSFKNLFLDFDKITFPACAKEKNCGNYPIYDCKTVTEAIYLIGSDKNKIYKQDNCYVIDGDSQYYLKSINYLKYKLLGIF